MNPLVRDRTRNRAARVARNVFSQVETQSIDILSPTGDSVKRRIPVSERMEGIPRCFPVRSPTRPNIAS
ncbi:hypothetical protein Trco_003795 [Trichoderma cornu-damae]|uniref:Uncharacterized protein n=1 Tax=Trichoderma cornu-damae TaxID=654480 RepID=A0A9P8QS14_9HYPO|nr:hypothetical protein Trco_003795 [Trichoderma cornu-damae]